MVQTRSQTKKQTETKVDSKPTNDEVNLLVEFKFSQTKEEREPDFEYILECCQFGKLGIIKNLFKNHKFDVNQKHWDGDTPLRRAIYGNQFEVVKYLVENGACVNAKDNCNSTPLYYACHYGELEMVKYLHEKGAYINSVNDSNWTPLHQASYWGRYDIVVYLVENGANINAETTDEYRLPIDGARYWKHTNIVDYLTKMNPQNENRQTKLHLIFNKSVIDISEIKKSLKEGVDVNERDDEGKTALYYACERNCDLDIIKLLVEHGADVDIQSNNGLCPIKLLKQQWEKMLDTSTYLINKSGRR